MKFNVIKGMKSADYPDLPDLQKFNRGYSAFFRGERVSHTPTSRELYDLGRRLNCLAIGRQETANEIALTFVERGLILVDITEEDGTVYTVVEKKVNASNPFNRGSLASKEWQRGFDAAFRFNRKKLRQEKRKAYQQVGRKGKPHAPRASGNLARTERTTDKSSRKIGNQGRKSAA
jgi:hypothetical protein